MKNFLKITMVLVLGVMLYACSKDNDSLPQEENSLDFVTTNNTKASGCNISTDNPYEYVGIVHNEILQVFVDEYPNGIKDVSELASKIDNIALNNSKFQDLIASGGQFEPTDSKILEEGMLDFDNNFHGMIGSLDVSGATKSRLKELVDFMFREGNSEKEPNYNDFDSALASFENGILNSTEFNQEERMILLSATSTARNSSCFWFNYYGGKGAVDANPAQKKRKWWQWVIVGVSDAAGAIIGGSATGGVGAISSGASASGLANTLTNPSNK